MYRVIRLAAILAVVFTHTAFAQENGWTGFQFGVHGGGAQTEYSSQLDNGDQFCFRQTSASGAGGATATCQFGPNFANALANVASPDGSVNVRGVGLIIDPTTVSATAVASGAIPGQIILDGTGVVANTDAVNQSTGPNTVSNAGVTANFFAAGHSRQSTVQAAGVAQAGLTGPAGTASSLAVALLNIFDLGNGGGFDATGFTIGGHVAYNIQVLNNIVAGFEVDVTATPNSDARQSSGDAFSAGNLNVNFNRAVSVDTDVIASARLKLGMALGDFLPYITGGIAYGLFNIDVDSSLVLNGAAFNSHKNLTENVFGGVLGGGVSWRFADNIILSAEGLYYNFDESIDISGATPYDSTNEKVDLEDIVEGRLKISILLN